MNSIVTRIPIRLLRHAAPPAASSLLLLLAALGLAAGPAAQAAENAPPNLMSYQGFLVDANGNPLGPTTPTNYTVVFRIFDAPTAGTLLWSEEQVVTVDRGNFSVVLGEGVKHLSETNPPLSSVLVNSATASDRYIGINVTIHNSPTEIMPRLRLLPTPYAFLATSARKLTEANGNTVLAHTGDRVEVTGDLRVTGVLSGNGAGLSGGLSGVTMPATNITSGTLPDTRLSANVARRDATNTFSGNQTVNGTVLATAFSGSGASLTNLDASKIASGTLADPRLSANVAMRNAANTFAANQVFTANLGIGTATPSAPLHVLHTGFPTAFLESSSQHGTWLSLKNTSSAGVGWNLISAGSNNGEGPGSLLFNRAGTSTYMVLGTNGLNVTGAIKADGQPAVVCEDQDQLRIVRGSATSINVTLNQEQQPLSGSGFKYKKVATGKLDVKFTSEFGGQPTVTATSIADGVIFIVTAYGKDSGAPTADGVRIRLVDLGAQNHDMEFNFIAIGPR